MTNPNQGQVFEGTSRWAVVALALTLLLLAVPATAQFANDGAKQNQEGGWDPDWGFCAQDPPPGPASANRYDCRSYILSAGTSATGGSYWNGAYDTQNECIGAAPNPMPPGGPAEWNSGFTCTNYWFRSSQSFCESNGGAWLDKICRGRWRWNPEAPANNSASYRNNCTRCHNQKYFVGSDLAVGEDYVKTGHKNMLRPVAPSGNTDPHYTTTYPWAGADGSVYATDSSGNPIDFAAGTVTILGVPKTLYWIFDGWIAETPRSLSAGQTYSCARCHTTGWSADAAMATTKQPYLMFGDYTGLFSTAGDGQPFTSWDQWGIQCSRCHGSQLVLGPPDLRHFPNITGKEAVGDLATGATRVALCMDCHRQETGGLPYPGQDLDPAGVLKVGPYHETVTFLSHWTGNLFLNSPHALFTGTFAEINDKSKYDSFFKNEGEDWPYSGNQGGCTQCHDVHKSTVAAANPDGGAIHEECTTCHAKDVNQLLHPSGVGTPIESKVYPNEACVACHMPEGLHLFRINVDEDYSTFPPAALTGTTNANTTPDGAAWVDLDAACGQCHGGGNGQATTDGTIAAGSKVLTVLDATGFAGGERVEIAGAGAGGGGFHTYIVSVVGSTLNLAGKATLAVTDAEVVQNPIKNNAAYFTKTQLAGYAKGMHNDKPVVYFSYKLGNPNTLQLNVDASASTCSGSAANCNAYDWTWGDGTCTVAGLYTEAACEAALGTFTPSANGSGLTASHVYPAGGTYPVTLTVTEYAIGSGERTLNVSVYAPDFPPTVGGTCVLDANTWVATVTDASSDDNGVAQVVVNWGDNSVVSTDTTAPFGPFGHSYIQPGSFTVARKVVDTIGQQTIDKSCVLTPAYFTLSGNVRRLNDAPVQLAAITVKKGLMTIRTVYSDVNGNYSVGNLKPGTYNLTAKKAGLTFAQVYNVLVGPSSGGYNFQSAQ